LSGRPKFFRKGRWRVGVRPFGIRRQLSPHAPCDEKEIMAAWMLGLLAVEGLREYGRLICWIVVVHDSLLFCSKWTINHLLSPAQ